MSDPVTNSEVEDVLSSIRRLVSEGTDKSAEASNPEFQFKSTMTAPPDDKLVLTEALRVPDPLEDAAPQEDEASETSKEPDAEAEQPVSETAEAENAQEECAEDDVPHQEDQDSVLTLDVDAAFAEGSEKSDVYVLGASPEEDTDWVFETTQDKPDDATDRLDLEEESEHAAPEDEPEAEVAADHDEPSDHNEPSEIAADALEAYEPEEGDAMADTPPVALSAKIAALEAVIGDRQDQWEPDGLGADAYAGTEGDTMEWEAEPEQPSEPAEATDQTPSDTAADTVEEPAQTNTAEIAFIHVEDENHAEDDVEDLEVVNEPAEREPEVQVFAADEDVLDEEALREMVSDIVRQELQGSLGERITRNVRKLVRREIHRALASHNLD